MKNTGLLLDTKTQNPSGMRERILQTLCKCHYPMEAKGKSWKKKSRRRKLNLDLFKSPTGHYWYDKLPFIPTRDRTQSSGFAPAKCPSLPISQATTVRNSFYCGRNCSNPGFNRPFQLVHFVFPFQTTWCPHGNFPFVFSLVMRKFARA